MGRSSGGTKSIIMKKLITTTLVAAALAGSARAQTLFEQDFSGSTTLSSYISATPNSGQWNAIGASGGSVTISVAANNLSFTRAAANAGSFSRTTDFSPTPATMIYRFDLSVSGNVASQTSAAVWQVGSGFGTANDAEAPALTYARFALNLTAVDGTFQIRDIGSLTSSGNLTGTQSMMWVLNNSGAAFDYTSPLGTTSTLADDTADIWAGTSKIFAGVAVTTPTQTMSDLKFAYTQGSGTITMDNFLITVPEPRTWALVALGGIAMLRRAGRARRR
jgi:hypothetical protein